jgi:hypothetical protein
LSKRAINESSGRSFRIAGERSIGVGVSVALQLDPPDPIAEARARYRGELGDIVAELAADLGYEPKTFVANVAAGRVAETDETAELIVAARLLG